ncbi:DsbA family protein [Gemmobacter fulvus]|uniref:DsbA family protein n=1 Tax=Gemmobacter fulvus TaxID=2840474 RepID=A0A975P6Q2_9RHOB|nr:DsbA family protein [Gemmobacter fulvus]QWK90645.1 DsbA family protein [Gemmobacter fulvus]
MTKKTFLAGTALALLLAMPAQAFDPAAMTDAERDAFGAQVRAYLMENPEVLMEAIAVLEQRQQDDSAQADLALMAENKEAIFNDGVSWVGGNPDGDITMVEFIDYRCGYCRKSYEETEELVKTDGNIRFVVKEFPILGEGSMISSQFAIAVKQVAGDAAYKKAHDALITLRGDATPEAMAALATELGLDSAEILAKMDTPEVMAVIQANHDLGTTLQINGTPSFIIDQTMVRGYVPLDAMRQIVDGQRKDG